MAALHPRQEEEIEAAAEAEARGEFEFDSPEMAKYRERGRKIRTFLIYFLTFVFVVMVSMAMGWGEITGGFIFVLLCLIAWVFGGWVEKNKAKIKTAIIVVLSFLIVGVLLLNWALRTEVAQLTGERAYQRAIDYFDDLDDAAGRVWLIRSTGTFFLFTYIIYIICGVAAGVTPARNRQKAAILIGIGLFVIGNATIIWAKWEGNRMMEAISTLSERGGTAASNLEIPSLREAGEAVQSLKNLTPKGAILVWAFVGASAFIFGRIVAWIERRRRE